MTTLRRILFPVDFSERCAATAKPVSEMARHFKAEVTLLHAVHIPPIWYGDPAAGPIPMWIDPTEMVEEGRTRLDSYLPGEFGDLNVSRVVQEGEPAQVITRFARNNGIDMIMMPTHGCGPFRRFLLGCVTAKVLHDAACPVWTDVHEPNPSPGHGFRSILCAVDLRPESMASIQWASRFAASYNSELFLVHAVPAAAEPTRPDDFRFRNVLIESAREFIADLQKKAGTTAKVCLGAGQIAESVRYAAAEHQADLVVIGQGSLHETLGGLRTNAYAIIRESPCPVVRV